MALAHPTLPREGRETFSCDYFINASDEMDTALKVRERTPVSLDDALRISQQLEAWTKDAQRCKITSTQPSRRCAVLVNLKVRNINSTTVWTTSKVMYTGA